MKKLLLLAIFTSFVNIAKAQSNGGVGINTTSPDPSAVLDIVSNPQGTATHKGVLIPRMTTADRNSIVSPASGLMIFNTSVPCFQINNGTPATPKWECVGGDPSSNGSAIVSSYNCSGGTSGTLSTGIPANGVTHSVIATVEKPGNYFITATANGVTFFASGVFTTTGLQEITLTAVGTPSVTGTFTYDLNTSPSCSFTMNVKDGTSNGTAHVNSWNCGTASAGEMVVGQTVSGVTQTITADVATIGSYDISVSNNGVVFAASGTFTGTGSQNIVLTAVGTPVAAGLYSYNLNVSNGCSFSRTAISKPVVVDLQCLNAVVTGTLLSGTSSNGVFVKVPYTAGNGAAYNTMIINSTGVTGLVAVLNAGSINNGDGELFFTISGTPQGIGEAVFPLSFGDKTCDFKINVSIQGAISSLACGNTSGSLTAGQAASGVTYSFGYDGGNAGPYSAVSVSSSGVAGLVASLPAGDLANGSANLTLTISGTPAQSGMANFNFTFVDKVCSFSIPVNAPSADVSSLDCAAAAISPGMAYFNQAFNGTVTVPYTNGNGGAYSTGVGVNSTGVTGLSLKLRAGTLANGGNGNLIFDVTGTPSGSGSTANFNVIFGSKNCTISIPVSVSPGSYPTGTGTLSGKVCFDVVDVNDSAEGCGTKASRGADKTNFATGNTFSYTFTPSGSVNNVRFAFVNKNGNVIESISGGNSGNNITTPVLATVNYYPNLNTTASGLKSEDALIAEIYVIYNNGATGGTTVQQKVVVSVKDCACCIANMGNGVYRDFLCHNLGADITKDPNVPSIDIMGSYLMWGERGPNLTGNSVIDWQTADNNALLGYAAPLKVKPGNASTQIPNWGTLAYVNPISFYGSYRPADSWLNANGKTGNDPCPIGYRIPSNSEWQKVVANNTMTKTGTWQTVAQPTNPYSQAIHFGPNASTKWLTFPAAGVVDNGTSGVAGKGKVVNVGNSVQVWSSTQGTEYNFANSLSLFGTSTSVSAGGNNNKNIARQIRCIRE
ncbi:FISUMP domain-containing protein [Chryseobacterium sp. AG363]|uniref:FISUMP domain-containing protein n=1 Tax=Chryseobacterium sp. AG363 TaxID=2183997 RepID=UPI000E748781|nr:FISUMP domain-containing protein [Chryseobacterium sp. AG363]RKE77170.1 uncharacterized protein (TIGR02145 family) [Chryseobacterium sp. AG363]